MAWAAGGLPQWDPIFPATDARRDTGEPRSFQQQRAWPRSKVPKPRHVGPNSPSCLTPPRAQVPLPPSRSVRPRHTGRPVPPPVRPGRGVSGWA